MACPHLSLCPPCLEPGARLHCWVPASGEGRFKARGCLGRGSRLGRPPV